MSGVSFRERERGEWIVNGASNRLARRMLLPPHWPRYIELIGRIHGRSVGAAMLEEMSKLRAEKENSSRSVHDKNNPLTNI